MKHTPALLITLLLATSGCAILRNKNTAIVIGKIAHDGTVLVLNKNPKLKPQFTVVAEKMKTLSESPQPSVSEVLTILQSLPVKEFNSTEGILAFDGAQFILLLTGDPAVDLKYAENMKAIIAKIGEGIEKGVAATP